MNPIALDANGNFIVNNSNALQTVATPYLASVQNFESETRCEEGTFSFMPLFGLDPLAWKLSQSVSDRIADLLRIGAKYLTVQSISYNTTGKTAGTYTVNA